MRLIKATVTEQTKARFKDIAVAKQMSEADLLREVLNIVVSSEPDIKDVEADSSKAKYEDEAGWSSVRIPKVLLGKIGERAKGKGMSKSRWITALVSTHFSQVPVLTDFEILALQESNRELAAIGRNINQVARALNEAFFETDRVKLALLAELSTAINSNREVISNLVRASRKSWSSGSESN